MRISNYFMTTNAMNSLRNNPSHIVHIVALVAAAVLIAKVIIPLVKKICAKLYSLPAPPPNPIVQQPIAAPAPVPPSNPIVQQSIAAPVPVPPHKPIAQLITEVSKHIADHPLSPEELESLARIDLIRFRSLGALALLPSDILRNICRMAGTFQASVGMYNIEISLKNQFENCKHRVAKHFTNAIVRGDYTESLRLVREMQTRWGENFENHFLELNFDLRNILFFSNLLEFSNHATTPPTVRSLIHFKMVEIPFERLNSDFIYRNVLVICHTKHPEEAKTLLAKMFVEVRLFEPFPWGLRPMPIDYSELTLEFLEEWMNGFIERVGCYQKYDILSHFSDLIAAFKGNWGKAPRSYQTDINIQSFEALKQAATESFTSELIAKAPKCCKVFMVQQPTARDFPQEKYSLVKVKEERDVFKDNLHRLTRYKIERIKFDESIAKEVNHRVEILKIKLKGKYYRKGWRARSNMS